LEICRYQKKSDTLIVNGQDPVLAKIKWPVAALVYNLTHQAARLITNKNLLAEHLKSDCLAAILAAQALKISNQTIIKALKTFKPRTGRLQRVKILKGVTFIDDGAATRIQAAMAALTSLPAGKVNLILEGSRKEPQKMMAEYLKLVKTLKEQRVKAIIVSGQIKKFLLPLLEKFKLKAKGAANLTTAVSLAYQNAKNSEIVLLSPAHESFGEFADYRERSKKFKEAVNKLR
jgi:UDP-N-acetylmuramoylalanine--D-glutamate ligase